MFQEVVRSANTGIYLHTKIHLLQSSFIFTGCTWIAMCDSLCLRLVRPSGFLMKPKSLQNSHYHISESFLSSISHRLEKMLLKDMFLFVFHSGMHRSVFNQSQKPQGWKFIGLFLFRLCSDTSGEVDAFAASTQKQ